MSIKPLGKLKELVESVDMEISYAYDDLVFLDHNAFLLQFGDHDRTVFIHTNRDADADEIFKGVSSLKKAASAANDIDIVEGVFYTLSQVKDHSISIEFHEHR